MKGQTHYISALLPKDLLSDLSISEDDFAPSNEEKDSSLLFPINIRRCISEDPINTNSKTINQSHSSSESKEKTHLYKKSGTFPKSKAPFIFEHEMEYNNLTFKQFLEIPKNRDNIVSIIMNCAGSHLLQKMIKTIEPKDTDALLDLLGEKIKFVMCDSYGNYFLQKIILKCNKSQRLLILTKIKNDFYEIANDLSGTHCIQSLVESLNSKEEEEIIKICIQNKLYDLSISQNSTHIIQKLVNKKIHTRNYLIQFLIQNFTLLSLNLNGAAIIKKFLPEVNSIQLGSIIISILEKNCLKIAENQFGNFIIQDAIDLFGYKNCEKLIISILNNAVYFALQKYASNVIDKIAIVVRKHSPFLYKKLIEILILNQSNLRILVENKYGMFVLGNLAQLMSRQEKTTIKNLIINSNCNFFLNNSNYYSSFSTSNSKLSKFLCLLS